MMLTFLCLLTLRKESIYRYDDAQGGHAWINELDRVGH